MLAKHQPTLVSSSENETDGPSAFFLPGDGERVIYWTYHPERSRPAVGLEVPRTVGLRCSGVAVLVQIYLGRRGNVYAERGLEMRQL